MSDKNRNMPAEFTYEKPVLINLTASGGISDLSGACTVGTTAPVSCTAGAAANCKCNLGGAV